MRTKIRLHGLLATKFGQEFEFVNLNKPTDFLSAMSTKYSNFLDEIKTQHFNGMDYEMVVNDELINDVDGAFEYQKMKTIDLVPSIAGHGVDFIIYAVVSAFVAAGVAYILSPKPQYNVQDVVARAESTSFVFGTQLNTTNQGSPVQVGYGRLRVGSQVIQTITKQIDKDSVDSNLGQNPQGYGGNAGV